jgi:agmatine deiminase
MTADRAQLSASRASSSMMPAEWARHRATWLAWPHNPEDWPGKLAPIPWVFAEVVRWLAANERVEILVRDYEGHAEVAELLARAGVAIDAVGLHIVPTNRVWTRDTGPLFVWDRDGHLRATGWRFNGWAKYADHERDGLVAQRIAQLSGTPLEQVDLVLEGGAIDVDGEGTLLATEECLLSEVQCRNPGLGRAGLESALAEHLGARKVLWLGQGIVGDDTHGHIDDLCRFVAPGRVVLVQEGNPRDDNYRLLAENWERLEGAKDALGRSVEVIALPMPRPLAFDGRRLPASYANFYVANGRVLVPTFNDPADRQALGILAELFPEREVVGIHAVDLVWGLGTLHCMTQQEPLARAG